MAFQIRKQIIHITIYTPSDSPFWMVSNDVHVYIQKAWESYLLLVPRIEALASP